MTLKREYAWRNRTTGALTERAYAENACVFQAASRRAGSTINALAGTSGTVELYVVATGEIVGYNFENGFAKLWNVPEAVWFDADGRKKK